VLGDLTEAFASVSGGLWSRSSVTNRTDPVVLDIDASLVQIHCKNKAGTAATYKGGFGFHPMYCFADATGETLSSLLRPGNAGDDHLTVLNSAINQLPANVAAGHRRGDDPSHAARAVMVRTDSAGCTTRLRQRLPGPQHRFRSGGNALGPDPLGVVGHDRRRRLATRTHPKR